MFTLNRQKRGRQCSSSCVNPEPDDSGALTPRRRRLATLTLGSDAPEHKRRKGEHAHQQKRQARQEICDVVQQQQQGEKGEDGQGGCGDG